jgi:transcriptional regulator with XRE-family HTH domain
VATFAERLRDLRKAAGLTQVDLAGDDLSPSYISLLESGKRSPSDDVIRQLAVRLGCSVSQLSDGQPSEREERLTLELAYARLAVEHGESADARSRLERLLADDSLVPRTRDEAELLLGRAHHGLGDPAGAVAVLQPLFDRACARQTSQSMLEVAIPLCFCYYASGDLHRASQVGSHAMEVAHPQGLAGTDDYFRLGATVMGIYFDLGDFLFARQLGERLAAEAEEADRPAGQAALYWNAAVLAEYEGRLGEAVRLCEQALARMGELDNSRDFARLRLAVAGILMACEPPVVDEASALLDRCYSDLRDLGAKTDFAEWAYVRSAVLLHRGDLARAEDQAREALALLRGQLCPEHVRALLALADVQMARGAPDDALAALRQASEQLEVVGSGRAIGLIWRELAERLTDIKDHQAAAQAFRRALDNGGIRDRSAVTREVVRSFATASLVAGMRRSSENVSEGMSQGLVDRA